MASRVAAIEYLIVVGKKKDRRSYERKECESAGGESEVEGEEKMGVGIDVGTIHQPTNGPLGS